MRAEVKGTVERISDVGCYDLSGRSVWPYQTSLVTHKFFVADTDVLPMLLMLCYEHTWWRSIAFAHPTRSSLRVFVELFEWSALRTGAPHRLFSFWTIPSFCVIFKTISFWGLEVPRPRFNSFYIQIAKSLEWLWSFEFKGETKLPRSFNFECFR